MITCDRKELPQILMEKVINNYSKWGSEFPFSYYHHPKVAKRSCSPSPFLAFVQSADEKKPKTSTIWMSTLLQAAIQTSMGFIHQRSNLPTS